MKNKKGFTIVEILTVVIIIGLILLVTIPTVKLISNSIKQRTYEAKITSIEKAAEEYAKNNRDQFGDATQIQVTVKTLLNYGYLRVDVLDTSESCDDDLGCIINPVDNVSMNDESISIKRNMSIYQAKFGEEVREDVLVYFEPNGASSIGADVISCKSGDEINFPEITRDGYEILGWIYNDPNGTVATYEVGDPLVLTTENAGGTYYAVTSKTLTATFNGNGTETTTSTQTCAMYNTETSCQITSPEIIRSEWDIVGWGALPTSTTSSLEAIAPKSITDDETYYAITSKTLAATFNRNGTTTTTSVQTCAIYNAATSCSVTAPTITPSSNYVQKGWSIQATSTTGEYFAGTSISLLVSQNSFYAIQTTSCYKVAERNDVYGCPSGYSNMGSYCENSYELIAHLKSQGGYKCYNPVGSLKCYDVSSGDFTGYWKAKKNSSKCSSGCSNCNASTCKTYYDACSGQITEGSGGHHYCTVTTGKIITETTYSCATGNSVGTGSSTKCYLYNQRSCSSGWTAQMPS